MLPKPAIFWYQKEVEEEEEVEEVGKEIKF